MSSVTKAWLRWISFSLAVGIGWRVVSVKVLGHAPQRTVLTDVVQGIIAGAVLAYVTANLLITAKIRALETNVNGWRTTALSRGKSGDGLLVRAAYAKDIAALNLPEAQVYWQTFVDEAGQALNGDRDYVLRFPPGGLPPNAASWSVTLGDTGRRMVENPIHRYSLGGRSGLVPNADGSLDIYIQNAAPSARESNWLPAPAGRFMLWLRVYQPGVAILSGAYRVPPVVRADRT